MKQNIILSLLALLLLSLVGCQSEQVMQPEDPSQQAHTLRVSLAPSTDTRAIIKDPSSKNVLFQWEVGSYDLHVAFKQGEVLSLVKNVEIQAASGEECTFEVTLPEGIDPTKPFDLIGAVAEHIMLKDGKLLVSVGGHVLDELFAYSSNRDGLVPIYFKKENVSLQDQVEATFQHLGSMAVINIKNDSDVPLVTAGFAVRPTDGTTEFYHKAALPFEGNTELPYIDLLDLSAAPTNHLTRVTYPKVVVPAQSVRSYGFWFCPTGVATPEISLVAYNATSRNEIVSTNTRPARAAMEAGKAYNLYAVWNGTELTLQSEVIETPLPLNQRKITLSLHDDLLNTDVPFIIMAKDQEAERYVWIDLNGNGQRDPGEAVTDFSKSLKTEDLKWFVPTTNDIAIYGDVTVLATRSLRGIDVHLTALDVNGNDLLEQIIIVDSQLGELSITATSNLKRLQLENCGLTKLELGSTLTNLQEIYLAGNQLTSLDISMAKDALGVDISYNQLAAVLCPSFTTLWFIDMQSNQLSKEAMELIYNRIQKAGIPYADWFYTATVFDNPGVATADHTILTKKGWTVVKDAPQNP